MSDDCWWEIQIDNLGSQLTPEKTCWLWQCLLFGTWWAIQGKTLGLSQTLLFTPPSQRSNQGGFPLWPSGICVQLSFWRCVQCEIIPRQTALVFQLLLQTSIQFNKSWPKHQMIKSWLATTLARTTATFADGGKWQQFLGEVVNICDHFWVRLSIFLTGSDAFGLWWHFPRIATGSMRC